jgi:hypothetical protein
MPSPNIPKTNSFPFVIEEAIYQVSFTRIPVIPPKMPTYHVLEDRNLASDVFLIRVELLGTISHDYCDLVEIEVSRGFMVVDLFYCTHFKPEMPSNYPQNLVHKSVLKVRHY